MIENEGKLETGVSLEGVTESDLIRMAQSCSGLLVFS